LTRVMTSCSLDKECSTTNSQPSLKCCLDSEGEDIEEFEDALEWSEGPTLVETSNSEGTDPELSEKHGSFLVDQELERVTSDWGIPHNYHECFSCQKDETGDYVFCSLSHYNPSHTSHVCSYFQSCYCDLYH
jgi:hypothetical protein